MSDIFLTNLSYHSFKKVLGPCYGMLVQRSNAQNNRKASKSIDCEPKYSKGTINRDVGSETFWLVYRQM